MAGFENKVAFIWRVADLLRGDFKPHEYGQVILPFTVLRRLDCVLEPTKDGRARRASSGPDLTARRRSLLKRAAGGSRSTTPRPLDLDEAARRPDTSPRTCAPTSRVLSPAAARRPRRVRLPAARSPGSTRPACSTWCSRLRRHRPAPGRRLQRGDGLPSSRS